MKEKFNILNTSIVEQAVDEAVRRVKHWTRKELEILLNRKNSQEKIPIIVQIDKHCFLVGNYACLNKDDHWYLIYRNNDQELQFQEKNSAVFYAICYQTNRYQLAEQILKYDNDILRLKIKADLYRMRYDKSIKTKKHTDAGNIYSCRYYETRARILRAQGLLEKSLKLAKYFNL